MTGHISCPSPDTGEMVFHRFVFAVWGKQELCIISETLRCDLACGSVSTFIGHFCSDCDLKLPG